MSNRDPLVAVRLPIVLLELLDAEVARRPTGRRAWYGAASRSSVIREALAKYFGREMSGVRYLSAK
ncbi:MAG TPA: hypothetical protein VMZ31_19655 [Phycisphaerae bacterium]|nr:hypothetical protein [Phycisphaerae bacterium]